MDDQRFDAMARALAAGTSRRRVLAGLAAGAVGVLTGGRARARRDASACAAILCQTGTKCCEVGGEGRCVPLGERCPARPRDRDRCGSAVCGAGEFCCNPSCGICAPLGGFCTQQACDEPPGICARVRCPAGTVCCEACGGTCEPDPALGACAAIRCAAGTKCCDVRGKGRCVRKGKPCPRRRGGRG